MNWNQLQYVITIAEEKSITKAAQKLYISQPSLSLSIQALEKETGIPLFERNRGEMKLTYAGSLFYEWAISTLHSHTQLEWKLGDIVSGSRTLIRLGLSPHRSERLLAPVLERFYSMYENCDIQIIEQPTGCPRAIAPLLSARSDASNSFQFRNKILSLASFLYQNSFSQKYAVLPEAYLPL